jgi:hypothetical protein
LLLILIGGVAFAYVIAIVAAPEALKADLSTIALADRGSSNLARSARTMSTAFKKTSSEACVTPSIQFAR